MKPSFFIRLFLISFLPLVSFFSFSQQPIHPTIKAYRQQLGFMVAKSVRSGYKRPATYVYEPTLFQLEWQRPLSKKDKRIKLDYVLQPQVNVARYKDSLRYRTPEEFAKSWEAGININLLLHTVLFYNAQAGKGAELYLQGGSGPHYIHASPSRQAKGFIFSDHILLGFRAAVTQHLLFDVRGGLRHLSNASLKQPNLGLDNVIVGAGIRMLH
ncbi:MAG: acyloxyacyl hydrolase [Flavisolibacter sp.]|nr:acyloxyacyl hydrolase [Flavisolibacter sp.]